MLPDASLIKTGTIFKKILQWIRALLRFCTCGARSYWILIDMALQIFEVLKNWNLVQLPNILTQWIANMVYKTFRTSRDAFLYVTRSHKRRPLWKAMWFVGLWNYPFHPDCGVAAFQWTKTQSYRICPIRTLQHANAFLGRRVIRSCRSLHKAIKCWAERQSHSWRSFAASVD